MDQLYIQEFISNLFFNIKIRNKNTVHVLEKPIGASIAIRK